VRTGIWLGTLVGFALLLRALYALFTPLWLGPDEHSHLLYIQYVYETHSLPVVRGSMFSGFGGYEYYQPPLYYVVAAVPYWLCELLGVGLYIKVVVLRAFSVLLGILLVVACYRGARLFFEDDTRPLFVAALVATLPSLVMVGSTINNGPLAYLLFTLFLIVLFRGMCRRRDATLAGILLGLAILTKGTAVAGMGLLALYILYERSGLGAMALVLSAIVALPMLVRNFLVYGSLGGGISIAHMGAPLRLLSGATPLDFARGLFVSFWDVRQPLEGTDWVLAPHWAYYALGVMCVISLVGLLLSHRWLASRMHMLCVAAPLLVLLVVLHFNLTYSYQPHGRLLYVCILPIGVLLVDGMCTALRILSSRASVWGLWMLIVLLTYLNVAHLAEYMG